MEYLFIIATSAINYTNSANQPAVLYKLLCKTANGQQHEVVSSSSPAGMPVAIAKLVKKGELLYKRKDGKEVKAEAEQYSVQYYTSADQVSAAKDAAARIDELNWA